MSYKRLRIFDFDDKLLKTDSYVYITNVDSQLNYAEGANDNMEITIQIESVKGFENLEEILKEKRIHRIAFGPNDLAADLGFPGQPGHKKVIDLHTKIEKLSRKSGKLIVGDYCKTLRFEDVALDILKRFKEESHLILN